MVTLRKCVAPPTQPVSELKSRANAAAVRQFVEARRALGWSQQDAAEYLGVSTLTVWRWENELTEIKGGYIIRMREAAHFERTSIQLAAGAA